MSLLTHMLEFYGIWITIGISGVIVLGVFTAIVGTISNIAENYLVKHYPYNYAYRRKFDWLMFPFNGILGNIITVLIWGFGILAVIGMIKQS